MAFRSVTRLPVLPLLRASASRQNLHACHRPLVVPVEMSRLPAASFVSASSGVFARLSPSNAVKTLEDDDIESDLDVKDAIARSVEPINVVAVDDDDNDIDDIQSVPWKVSSSVDRRPFIALQDESSINIRMDMPGICRDNVIVYLDDKKLIIKGKYPKRSEVSLDDDEDHIFADDAGAYYAEVDLPDNANKEGIKTEMRNGVLVVNIPKSVTMIPVN